MKIDVKKINIELARRQLSITEFCSQSQIPSVTIEKILRGVRNPRPKTIGRIASALNVDVTEIIQDAVAAVSKDQ